MSSSQLSTFTDKSSSSCKKKLNVTISSIRDDYPTGFHNLPAKVLINIFKYLKEKDLRSSVIPVGFQYTYKILGFILILFSKLGVL